jgi:hypothetical protein
MREVIAWFKFDPEIEEKNLEQILREKISKKYKKGYLILAPIDISFGWNGDDFINNLMTCVIKSRYVKVPRIVKKIYRR